MLFKKPEFWDKKNSSFISILLSPLTIFIKLNNCLINRSKKIKSKNIFSICVGNIYVGGTGKTPTTIKLFKIIHHKINRRVVTAKKFYSYQLDEEILLRKKTKFLTGKNRLDIINTAKKNKNKIIIFDDGLQEKKIDYNLKFVCFDSLKWIGNGKLLPSGPMREKVKSLTRFDGIFLKNINKPNFRMINLIKKINPKIKIYNSSYKIRNIKKFNLLNKYIIFSAIGNPESFKMLLKKYNFKIIKDIRFPDHYEFKNQDIEKIISIAKKLKTEIVTTEKDYVKIKKIYQKKIKCLEVDLKIQNEKNLIHFLKSKIYA